MKQSRNMRNVTFQEAIGLIRGVQRSNLMIQFRYQNSDNVEVAVRSMRVSALYRDWYGDCNLCPSNDTVVTQLHFRVPTCMALKIVHPVSFEEMMDAIEEATVGHKAEK